MAQPTTLLDKESKVIRFYYHEAREEHEEKKKSFFDFVSSATFVVCRFFLII
jgi:hypothetical protein